MTPHSPFAPGPCPYELDDGAYILGALAPAERAEYERHLASCPPCRDAMTQLAVLPGLLGRLDPATAAARTTSAPASLLPRVLAAMRAQRAARRRRRLLAGAAAAVVAVAAGALVGLGARLVNPPPGPDTTVAALFRPMNVDNFAPVEAQIGITEQETGTLVTVRCRYQGASSRSWEIWLVVYPRDAEAESIGSWNAVGGMPIEVSTVTHYAPAQIDRIELQNDDHTTLAWWSP